MSINRSTFFLSLVLIALVFAGSALPQKRKKTTHPAAPAPAAPQTEQVNTGPTPSEPARTSLKKNERPTDASQSSTKLASEGSTSQSESSYYYEFAQPNFTIAKIVIKHDDAGKGTITFSKKSSEEQITDPLQVSADALARINDAYAALNFLDSNENYQYEKDYSHLGNSTFKLRRREKERTTTFNYTQNKDAKTLADEYRKLANQYVWMFDITVARESQPLDAPRLMESLDSLIKRGEISDPRQLIPFLNGLSNDERIPLMARNRAAKIVAQVERSKN